MYTTQTLHHSKPSTFVPVTSRIGFYSDINHDEISTPDHILPIAQKGKQSCTSHPLYKFVSYAHCRSHTIIFCLLNSHFVPKSLS